VSDPHVPLFRCVLVREGATVGWPRAELRSSYQAAAIVDQLTADSPVEKLVCVYLDSRTRITGAEIVAVGTERSIHISPSALLRGAIIHCAPFIVVGHNHPSGDPTPTEHDIEMTLALAAAAKTVGIELFDHVVVAYEKDHRSIREEPGVSW
jgi:DNA repair protein RadC